MSHEQNNEPNREKLWPHSLEELYEAEIESFLEGETEESEFILSSLKYTDDVALPESGVYFDALEARIMGALDAAIESGEVENRDRREPAAVEIINPVLARRAASRRAAAIRAGQMVMFIAVAIVMTGKWILAPAVGKPTSMKAFARKEAQERGTTGQSTLQATKAAAPKVLTGTVMSHESKDDLALEIAARRLVAYHKGK